MTAKILSLLNMYPITTRDHTPQEKALAEAGINELRKIITYKNEIEMVKAVINEGGVGKASSAMADALKTSGTYSQWQKSMPYLKDVKNIHSYRNNKKYRHDIKDVNNEIITTGGFLQKGQVLFRGGNFEERDFSISNGPISTTTLPSVARWHGIEVNGEISILKIATSNKIKAFVFKIKGNQKHTNEFEVIIQNNLILKFIESFTQCKMKVIIFEVHNA